MSHLGRAESQEPWLQQWTSPVWFLLPASVAVPVWNIHQCQIGFEQNTSTGRWFTPCSFSAPEKLHAVLLPGGQPASFCLFVTTDLGEVRETSHTINFKDIAFKIGIKIPVYCMKKSGSNTFKATNLHVSLSEMAVELNLLRDGHRLGPHKLQQGCGEASVPSADAGLGFH